MNLDLIVGKCPQPNCTSGTSAHCFALYSPLAAALVLVVIILGTLFQHLVPHPSSPPCFTPTFMRHAILFECFEFQPKTHLENRRYKTLLCRYMDMLIDLTLKKWIVVYESNICRPMLTPSYTQGRVWVLSLHYTLICSQICTLTINMYLCI